MAWTQEQDRRLMELWKDGATSIEIAVSGEFNGYSRNAILGRLFRLRKKWGSEMVPSKKAGHPPAQPKKRVRRKPTNFAVKGPLLPRDPTPIKTPPAPPTARRIPLLELGPKDCRFIVTGNDREQAHLYCAVDASPYADEFGNNCYCYFHQRIMRAGGFPR